MGRVRRLGLLLLLLVRVVVVVVVGRVVGMGASLDFFLVPPAGVRAGRSHRLKPKKTRSRGEEAFLG